MKKKVLSWIAKPYRFAVLYGVILILFTAYVLLKTFIIPENGKEVGSGEGNFDNASNLVMGNGTYTDNSYQDENVKISISTIREQDTQVYIADITVSSAAYLKTALAENQFGRNIKETTSDMAEEHNAILAINGDYYGFRDYGFVIRNGELYRDTQGDGDALVLYEDGTLSSVTESETTADRLSADGAWQALSFGPVLLKNGTVMVDENTEVDMARSSNPRTAIGMITPLHYVIIVSDGRTNESEGLSLYELAGIFKDQGCSFAYNLDGGGSSTLWFHGKVMNHPTDGRSSGERKVSDIVYIG